MTILKIKALQQNLIIKCGSGFGHFPLKKLQHLYQGDSVEVGAFLLSSIVLITYWGLSKNIYEAMKGLPDLHPVLRIV